jgi:hypothetical protein
MACKNQQNNAYRKRWDKKESIGSASMPVVVTFSQTAKIRCNDDRKLCRELWRTIEVAGLKHNLHPPFTEHGSLGPSWWDNHSYYRITN